MDLQHPDLVAIFKEAEGIIHAFQSLKSLGQLTASALPFNEHKLSIAHVTLPASDQFLRERLNPKTRGLKGVI